ncbi:LOW QUALITY PROTEIN: maltose/maltodextrin ABC transporter, substrate binding periplasmic protein MalE [Geomicrobium sp. JCM 19037]|nr:LOW QUALITY PROTEIN: maltose/maltodextrin ABC transporter, substrate binding periplasmic protein MalE [Geomicrobium sp. JCM 19037]
MACAPDREEEASVEDPDNTESEGAEPDKPDQLHMWIHDNDEQANAIEDMASQYTEATGIEVQLTRMNYDDQAENIALDGPAGTGPDIYFKPHDYTGELAVQSLAEPLDLDEEQLERFTPESLQAMTYEGELYGLPFVSETAALLYNVELVEEAPETIEDLLLIAEELTDAGNDEYGFLTVPIYYYSHSFITGYGGYIFGENESGYDVGDVGLANDGAIEGAKRFQSLFEDGLIPSSINPEIQDGLFAEGKIGVSHTVLGISTLMVKPLVRRTCAQLRFLFKNGEPASSLVGFKSWLLSPYSEHQYWAQDLMLHLTSDEQNMSYYMATGEMPAVSTLLEAPEIADDELMSGFAEQIVNGEPMPNVPEIDPVFGAMGDAMLFLADGEDADEIMTEAVEQIQQDIDTMN